MRIKDNEQYHSSLLSAAAIKHYDQKQLREGGSLFHPACARHSLSHISIHIYIHMYLHNFVISYGLIVKNWMFGK